MHLPIELVAAEHPDHTLEPGLLVGVVAAGPLKIKLQQREKKQNKLRDINMMLTMFVTTVVIRVNVATLGARVEPTHEVTWVKIVHIQLNV